MKTQGHAPSTIVIGDFLIYTTSSVIAHSVAEEAAKKIEAQPDIKEGFITIANQPIRWVKAT